MSISAQLPSANLNISGSGSLGYAGFSLGGKRKRTRGGRANFTDNASRYSGGAPTMPSGGLPAMPSMPSMPAVVGGRRRKQKSHKNSKRSRGGKSCKKRK